MPEDKVLSEREEQILRLVATGMTNREIAQELTISPNTVKVHLSNVFEKIGVASRTEATLYGIEHGIVAVPGNGNQGAVGEPAEESFLKKYLWVWVPGLVVLVAFLVYILFGTDLIFPQATPTPAGVQSLAEIEDRWVELAPMPEPRTGLAGTAYDGKVYAIAGEGPEGVSGSVFRYIPDEDRWESLRDKPTPVRDVQAVLIGEKIYVPGGELAVGRPTEILEIYDPRANTWEQGAPLPQPISAYALADYEGQMYLFGGWDGEKALDVVYIYDPDEDAWQEGTPMPTARYHAGAGEAGGKIYVVGGWDGGERIHLNQVYYPNRDMEQENPWQDSTMDKEQFPLNMQSLGSVLISFNESEDQSVMVTYYYPQQDEWVSGDQLFSYRSFYGIGSANFEGNVYLFGGETTMKEITPLLVRYKGLYIVTFPNVTQ